MKKFLFLFFLFMFSLTSQDVGTDRIIQNFFSLYAERGSETALDYLFANNPVLYNKVESISSLKKTFLNIEKVIGSFKSYEIIFHDNVQDTLQIYIVIVKYERQPLRYLFVFYKPEKKWITYRFEIDTKYPDNYIEYILKQQHFEN
ncbi:MAG: DUF3887 domain-containing protein [Leptospiraceae bacterium]|nr:DUF3887 domain-containing protein [Leptospiraceae bacterium]MDW7975644.1 hypothetical protein [Leptospiraceae bacterium]